jgi:hypothetical protein
MEMHMVETQSQQLTPPADSPAGRIQEDLVRVKKSLRATIVRGAIGGVLLFVGIPLLTAKIVVPAVAIPLIVGGGLYMVLALWRMTRIQYEISWELCPQCHCHMLPRQFNFETFKRTFLHCEECGADLTISDGRTLEEVLAAGEGGSPPKA